MCVCKNLCTSMYHCVMYIFVCVWCMQVLELHDNLLTVPCSVKQYEMAVTNYFITKHNYAHLESYGATNIIVPLLGTSTFTTPTGAVLLQTFEVILYPGNKFDVCNFTHSGEAGSMKHGYVSQDGYRRHTLDFLWKYSRPVDIVVDIVCPVWYSYTPESISTASPHMPHHKTEVKQKLVVSLVTG